MSGRISSMRILSRNSFTRKREMILRNSVATLEHLVYLWEIREVT